MAEAFFRMEGDRFVATPHTTGPWDPKAQHAGPPTALLVRALEGEGNGLGKPHLARVTVEILRPVPIAALTIVTEVHAAGRSVARLGARLFAGERELMRATAIAMRSRPLDAKVTSSAQEVPSVDAAEPLVFPFFRTEVGYHTAVELRIARGTFGKTPTFAWLRPRIPLVEGEALTPAQRVAIAADSGNGVSPILDWRKNGFINPDLTIAWHRPSEGDWVGLDATTDVNGEHGVGLARTVICDARGALGVGLQTLLCDPMPA